MSFIWLCFSFFLSFFFLFLLILALAGGKLCRAGAAETNNLILPQYLCSMNVNLINET